MDGSWLRGDVECSDNIRRTAGGVACPASK
jgi:hypothetical protein